MHGNIKIVTVQKMCYYCRMKWLAYLQDHFGLKSTAIPAKQAELKGLPLYLQGSFKLFTGRLENRKVLWAEAEKDTDMTPDQLSKQGSVLKNLFKMPVIFVFNKLDTWNRKRLIEKKVAFLQSFKQLYVPDLLIELSDVLTTEKTNDNFNEFLSFPAQCLLLYHLQMDNLENKPFRTIASTLGYSKMTVSRSVKELGHFSLAAIIEGKEKSIKFELSKKNLWKKALPFLRSPVMDVWYSNVIHAYKGFIEGGEWALSSYTMIANPEVLTYAIGKQAFRKWEKETKAVHLDKRYGSRKIEVWQYDPMLMVSKNERVADKLSVYLSLKDEKDERVQGELRELINKAL
jgi:hypothetical protein